MNSISEFSKWTPGLYRLFRVLLGTYLVMHFAYLLPWSTEVFSSNGMIASAQASPLFTVLPNLFWFSDGAWVVLISLFCRNPLIANPALPYLGWMLMAHLFVPRLSAQWRSPGGILAAAAVVLAISYSYSGWTKLLSPTWMAGDTLAVVLQNPLARDWFLRDLFLLMPDGFLQLVTLFILWVELLYAPLYLIPKFRFALWASMLLVQVGFLFLLNFPDLTFAMLLFHLLTFEPRWVQRLQIKTPAILFYDGECGFCHGVVQFTLTEDPGEQFSFRPLQEVSNDTQLPIAVTQSLDSMVVRDSDGQIYTKSDALVIWLRHLAGLWPAVGILLSCVPQPIRDAGYHGFGKIRLWLHPKPEGLCPIVPHQWRKRF